MIIFAITVTGLLLRQSQCFSQAAVTCSTGMANNSADSDSDGFTDYQECNLNGIATLIDSTHKVYGKLKWPGVSPNPSCPASTTCHKLDPDKRTLFVIIVKPTSGSVINQLTVTNADLLQYVSAEVSAGGLGIAVHPINKTSYLGNRTVISASTQKAVMVTESLDTSSTEVSGFSNTGLPGRAGPGHNLYGPD